ncbi:tRNA uridine(34) 5-carboxymethylaminomethyl modification radical SAM/GNAT enzyme Elp3 [Candidatus Kuenenbacteria bacterium]|nr:tRNA uridine(34) 5-carboxymethylaminomethyl modification radical SAM/GNAT enzyme Elp3 [Candidatus Kuenenbacteria bacterium]
MSISSELIKYLQKNPPQAEEELSVAKRLFAKKFKMAEPPTNSELLLELKKTHEPHSHLLKFLRKRKVRTLSGIAAVTVLAKPHPCPGTCAYCPHQKKMPVSYLKNEPAVMRAVLCKFDPYKQVQMRLRALQNNGHATDKLELIVLGGTWSYYPKKYQFWFIKECFRAANDFPKNKKANKALNTQLLQKQLLHEQKKNESATNRIIGLTLETRPDYINEKELQTMRLLGCTRVEIGVQHLDDQILKLNKRGHLVAQTIKATALLRQFGFKITYHLMLNLPGSTPAKDLTMFKRIYSDPHFQPDQIKIYPCVVARNSLLYQWWQKGKWHAYSDKALTNLIIKIKTITPPWVRLIRIIRDIPEESIIAGNKITNLRQEIKFSMTKQNLTCQCIRCREAGHQNQFPISNFQFPNKSKVLNPKLFIRTYPVSNGTEYFLSYESPDQKILYAFCRLFLPTYLPTNLPPYQPTALLRELHTYGEMVPLNQKGAVQHTGLGKKLLTQAEKITHQNHYQKLSIISGIGVRGYYKKLGYKLENTYMVKSL